MLAYLPLYLYAFGLFAIVGGVLGFVKAKSRASLIAGGLSGLLLLIAGWLVGSGRVTVGGGLGLVTSIALAGRFVPAFRKTGKVMPAGIMSVLAVLGIVVTGYALFVR